jgi:hypothetical protein
MACHRQASPPGKRWAVLSQHSSQVTGIYPRTHSVYTNRFKFVLHLDKDSIKKALDNLRQIKKRKTGWILRLNRVLYTLMPEIILPDRRKRPPCAN